MWKIKFLDKCEKYGKIELLTKYAYFISIIEIELFSSI